MTDEKEIKKQEEVWEENEEENEEEKSSQDNEQSPPIEEREKLMANLPPEARKVVEFGMMSMQQGPMPNPIMGKINEKHIDAILEHSEKYDERSFLDTKSSRRYTLTYIIIFVALFVFLTIFLVSSDTEMYKELIKLVAVFFGGFGGGFGVKSYIDRK